MTFRKWLRFAMVTLGVGVVAMIVTAAIMQVLDPQFRIEGFADFGVTALLIIFMGLLISAVSQMGFFAYLTLNYYAKHTFRKRRWLWDTLQLLVAAVVLFDLAFLRYLGDTEAGWLPYAVLPVVYLVGSILVALWKVRLTNIKGFIPTFFFMAVVSTFETIPALAVDNPYSIWFFMAPMFVCNAWQILNLQRLTDTVDPAA